MGRSQVAMLEKVGEKLRQLDARGSDPLFVELVGIQARGDIDFDTVSPKGAGNAYKSRRRVDVSRGAYR